MALDAAVALLAWRVDSVRQGETWADVVDLNVADDAAVAVVEEVIADKTVAVQEVVVVVVVMAVHSAFAYEDPDAYVDLADHHVVAAVVVPAVVVVAEVLDHSA